MILAELLYDVPAIYDSIFVENNLVFSNYSQEIGRDISKGSVVEIFGQYQDVGFWQEEDGSNQSPFPAYYFRFDGIKYCSVHINCFKIIT